MPYIWINPVTEMMYDKNVLGEFLKKHGYHQVYTNTDYVTVVKEKYKEAVRRASGMVIDVRCPKIKQLIDEYGLSKVYNITVPDISPILIHCGQELSGRMDLEKEDKVITTPCHALADVGNGLNLPRSRFITWNDFLKELGEEPMGRKLNESPIPLGFFKDEGMDYISLSGEDNIHSYFTSGQWNGPQLAELLYCEGGCHKGDGILSCHCPEKGRQEEKACKE